MAVNKGKHKQKCRLVSCPSLNHRAIIASTRFLAVDGCGLGMDINVGVNIYFPNLHNSIIPRWTMKEHTEAASAKQHWDRINNNNSSNGNAADDVEGTAGQLPRVRKYHCWTGAHIVCSSFTTNMPQPHPPHPLHWMATTDYPCRRSSPCFGREIQFRLR